MVRRGREIAAIVPIEDLELLERLEDESDLQEARAALADPENGVPIRMGSRSAMPGSVDHPGIRPLHA